MSIVCDNGKYIMTCDLCGHELDACDSLEEAIQSARNNKWQYNRLDDEDYCDECKDEE